MHRIEFTRSQAFLLEDSNLQRMLGIVHGYYGQDSYQLTFSVVLSGGKKLKFDSVDDLLRHDNTVADSIHQLRIQAVNSEESLKCEIFFYGKEQSHLSGITINVESNEQRTATSLSAELEEQVERIKMPGIVYQLRQLMSFKNILTTLLLSISILLSVMPAVIDFSKASETQEEAREILRLAESAKTQDAKIDILFRAQIADLQRKNPKSFSSEIKLPSIDVKWAIGLLPLVVCLVLLWYLVNYCYPPAIFSWGDSGKQFQQLIELRKNLWSVLFTVIVLGFLVNVSSPIISGWLGV